MIVKIQTVIAAQYCKDVDFGGKIVVVIDVFRATSVITTALANGAHSVVPLTTVEEAEQLFSACDPTLTLKGGERNSVKIDGFDLGNSPLEYKKNVVGGKDVIFTTTNGTQALNSVQGSDEIVLACFRNMVSVADYLLRVQKDLVIVCSGTHGQFSLDDGLCAGRLVNLLKSKTKVELDDISILLSNHYEKSKDNLFGALVDCFHVKYLFGLGFYDDIVFCLQTDCEKVIPIFKDGKCKLMSNQ